jgi:hypothetical protein
MMAGAANDRILAQYQQHEHHHHDHDHQTPWLQPVSSGNLSINSQQQPTISAIDAIAVSRTLTFTIGLIQASLFPQKKIKN